MELSIILAGVGGQGILTIAYMLDNAGLAKGFNFKQAEIHGMAQRGGAVQAHVRISDKELFSDLVPRGQADMILAVEPLEVGRYVDYLSKNGIVVASGDPYMNIPDYPKVEVLHEYLLNFPKIILLQATKAAKLAGSSKATNMVMLGAAIPFLPFEIQDFHPHIEKLFAIKGERMLNININALTLGYRMSRFFSAMVDAGVRAADVFRFMKRVKLETISLDLAPQFAGLILEIPNLLDQLEADDKVVPGDSRGLEMLSRVNNR